MSNQIPLGLKPFVTLPPSSSSFGIGSDYRYRKVRDVKADSNDPRVDDLSPFVDLSDNDAAISAAHESLKGPVRHALYKKWFDLNPDSFLILDHKGENGTWRPAAVSIVLPLTQTGFEHLRDGSNDAVGLTPADVIKVGQPDPLNSPHLLLDTWIIDPKFRRGQTKGYGQALITKHLSSFWDPEKQPNVNISVEPDAESVRRLLKQAHFHEPEGKSNLYDLEVNTRALISSPVMQRIAQNFDMCRQWPVEGVTRQAPLEERPSTAVNDGMLESRIGMARQASMHMSGNAR